MLCPWCNSNDYERGRVAGIREGKEEGRREGLEMAAKRADELAYQGVAREIRALAPPPTGGPARDCRHYPGNPCPASCSRRHEGCPVVGAKEFASARPTSEPQHVCGLKGFGVGMDGVNDECPACRARPTESTPRCGVCEGYDKPRWDCPSCGGTGKAGR